MTLFIGYDEHKSVLLLSQWLRNITKDSPCLSNIQNLLKELNEIKEWKQLHVAQKTKENTTRVSATAAVLQNKRKRKASKEIESAEETKEDSEDEACGCRYNTLSDWVEAMLTGNTDVNVKDWKRVFLSETGLTPVIANLYGYGQYDDDKKIMLVDSWIAYSCDQGSDPVESFALSQLDTWISKCHETTKRWACKILPPDKTEQEELQSVFKRKRLLVSWIQEADTIES